MPRSLTIKSSKTIGKLDDPIGVTDDFVGAANFGGDVALDTLEFGLIGRRDTIRNGVGIERSPCRRFTYRRGSILSLILYDRGGHP